MSGSPIFGSPGGKLKTFTDWQGVADLCVNEFVMLESAGIQKSDMLWSLFQSISLLAAHV